METGIGGGDVAHGRAAHVMGYQIDDLSRDGGGGLLGVAASRLEGSKWDGSVLVYEVVDGRCGDDDDGACAGGGREAGVLKLRSAHRTPHCTASVAFAGGVGGGDLLLAAAQDNGDIQVGSLRLVTTMAEHEHVVSCVRVDRTSLLMASASWDGGIRLWNLGHPAVSTRELTGHTDHVDALAWNFHVDSILGSVSKDRTLQLWDLRAKSSRAGQLVHRLAYAGTSLAWAPDRHDLLAVGLDDGSVALFDTRKADHPLVTSQRLHSAPVFSLCFAGGPSSTPLLVVSGGDDGALVLSGISGEQAPTITPRCKIPCHGDYIRSLATWGKSHDQSVSKIIFSGGWDSTILWHKL